MDPLTITRKQIQNLEAVADSHGDTDTVFMCERAMDGCPIALQCVADAIASWIGGAA
jgi:hypothetical protein